ncbi:MAG: universal stress protein [Planctomycetaceae bacterium]|nr:universal stress protein [Planctomycetaceae bacterium]
MVSIQNILVGVDLQGDPLQQTDQSARAVRGALRVAQLFSAKLTLMTVFKSPPVETAELMESDENPLSPEKAARAVHSEIAEQAKEMGVAIESKITHGPPAETLIKEVLRSGADLLVAGARQRSAASRMIFGSTSQDLLRQCPCPLWIPREGSFDGDISTIVAADNLESVGEKVLQFAVSAAQFSNSRMLVLHAVQYPLEGGLLRTEAPAEELEEYKRKVKDEAEAEIAKRLTHTDYRTIQEGTVIEVEAGPPEAVIEDAVREHQADLLVIGTIARKGLSGLLLGNSVERVLSEIPCSVLAIKPDDFECPISLDS